MVACDRTPSHRQTRAGTAIALETRHTAADLAERLAARPHAACGAYTLSPSSRAQVRWVVEGGRDGAVVLELDETRTVEVDVAGNIRVLRQVEFLAERGRTGQREREWRLVDGFIYTRDLNLPFERREADVTDAARLLDQSAEVFETLVRATPGWTIVAEGSGFELRDGHDRVRCGREGEPDPWLGPLLTEARVTEARADVERGPQTVSRAGSFTIAPIEGEGRDLRVVVEEEVAWGVEVSPIAAPDDIADVQPPRLYAQVSGFLRDLEAIGGVRAVEVDLAGTGEGTGSP